MSEIYVKIYAELKRCVVLKCGTFLQCTFYYFRAFLHVKISSNLSLSDSAKSPFL